MKSGHVRRARSWAAWAFVCATLGIVLCGTTVQAQAPVVCAGFDDAELLARIRGQTRDLPIVLVAAPNESVAQPTAAQLLTIARKHKAEFVVSVDQEPGSGRVVYVFDALSSELRVRTAPAPDRKHRFGRSAAAETVALIVRGELSDALAVREEREQAVAERSSSAQTNAASGAAGPAHPVNPVSRGNAGSAGTARTPEAKRGEPQAAREGTDQPAQAERAEGRPKPTDTARAQNEVAAEESVEEPEVEEEENSYEPASTSSWLDLSQFSLELAGRASTVIDDRYFLGPALTVRWSVRYVSLGITGTTTIADHAERQGLTLTLREHSVGLEGLTHLPLSAAFSGGLGAVGRFSFYPRSASSSDPSWKPQPFQMHTTAAIGPIAELRWLLHQHLGIAVRIGLDVLLQPVTFRYRLDTNMSIPIELARQNRVAPWLSLGIFGNL